MAGLSIVGAFQGALHVTRQQVFPCETDMLPAKLRDVCDNLRAEAPSQLLPKPLVFLVELLGPYLRFSASTRRRHLPGTGASRKH